MGFIQHHGRSAIITVVLSLATVIVLTCGCDPAAEKGVTGTKDAAGSEKSTSERYQAFLTASAELNDETGDAAASYMADLGREYIHTREPSYASGSLPSPDIRFFKIDFDGRKTESYFLVWLPDDWASQEARKAIVYSQGHGARTPRSFPYLHRYAVERNMAIFMPQIWIEGEAPSGYRQWEKGPMDIKRGLPDGYHLKAADEYMFLNSVVSEYGVQSVYLYGFSISGAMVMEIAAYDHLGPNVVDLTVVSGGGMYYGHHFLDQMRDMDIDDFFSGENFFFFGEIGESGGRKPPEQHMSENDCTVIITEHGGNLVMEEWDEVSHGGLHKQLTDLMNRSLDLYGQLLAERLQGSSY